MKKALKFAVVGAVLLIALTLTVGMAAAKYGPPTRPVNPPAGGDCATNFVDADGDGICDLAGTGTANSYGNASNYGNGVADGTGSGMVGRSGMGSQGANRAAGGSYFQSQFIDADGDGVCDNYAQ